MKRLFFLMVVLMAGAVMQAQAAGWDENQDGKVTLEEYVGVSKAIAEKKGEKFDEEALKKYFAKRDANGDGVLTGAETAPVQKK